MINLELDNKQAIFSPGDHLKGTVAWELSSAPKSVELRLFWYTTGRGTRDVGLVETRKLQSAAQSAPTAFSFDLPPAPYSFTGKLITLSWAVELVIQPHSQTERVEFAMFPNGQPVNLIAPDTTCPKCRYDLRATPDRCPECGTVMPVTE